MQQFSADAAHELRTPISSLIATAENAHEDLPLSLQETQQFVATIERQSQRLAKLVQDLLLLSQIEQTQQPSYSQSCNLNDLVTDVVESVSILKIAAPIELVVQIGTQERLFIQGNEAQLSRSLTNLVMNALQYTPARGKVTVILTKQDHDAVIQVQDTGIGISSQDQARIFERFYRVSRDRSRQTGGSGLGLAITKAIVRSHHGSIQVESRLDRGSTFTVRLPLISKTSSHALNKFKSR
jgi:signal transduction histidine kinase